MLKRILKNRIFIVLAGVGILFVGLVVYLQVVATVEEPTPGDTSSLERERNQVAENFYTLGNNWFRKSGSGLFEMYIEGKPFERGVAAGKLSKELTQYQEKVFNTQIEQLIPSSFYRGMLKYFVGWFNRNLDENILEEYKLEIFGVSKSFSDEYNHIAPPYQRIMNYHAAHDIGHALQNMSLVGCTSFATWGNRSEDGSLIIGRNFDFFSGDDFARNKIVLFVNPDEGYKFVSITWAGMMGVLSGMNDQGLTVTINAAKSEIPAGAATPVSLVAREILQYASTIDEAYAIAAKRNMFVSESFLIGSLKDNRAALIEKTDKAIELFESDRQQLVSTNHFQSKTLGGDSLNREHMRTSASAPRFNRVEELLSETTVNTVTTTAAILRDPNGLNNRPIGLGNEQAINQLVAHHSVIFHPASLRIWVSTSPWQLGKYVCYDLNEIFKNRLTSDHEIYVEAMTIPADESIDKGRLADFEKFSNFRFPFQPRENLQPDSLVKWNPDLYLSYMLAADFYFDKEKYAEAIPLYKKGLTLVVATEQERKHMQAQLEKCKDKL